jgi:hypothetical protein
VHIHIKWLYLKNINKGIQAYLESLGVQRFQFLNIFFQKGHKNIAFIGYVVVITLCLRTISLNVQYF